MIKNIELLYCNYFDFKVLPGLNLPLFTFLHACVTFVDMQISNMQVQGAVINGHNITERDNIK